VNEVPEEILEAFDRLGLQEKAVQNHLPPRSAKSLKRHQYNWLRWITYAVATVFVALVVYWVKMPTMDVYNEAQAPLLASIANDGLGNEVLLTDAFLFPAQRFLLIRALPLPLQHGLASDFLNTPLQTAWFDNLMWQMPKKKPQQARQRRGDRRTITTQQAME